MKKRIRSGVGSKGMMLFTLDQKEACIAYDIDGTSYSLRNEPAIFWDYREEAYELTHIDYSESKEERKVLIRIVLEGFLIVCLQTILEETKIVSAFYGAGIGILLWGIFFILEFNIFKCIQRKKTPQGIRMAKYRGALNKALNAMEKNGFKALSLEKVKKASLYRKDRIYISTPQELLGIFFLFLSVWLFIPSNTLMIASIPFFIIMLVWAYKTSLFGVLTLASVAEPDEYEIKMAYELVKFWYDVSYSELPEKRH